VRPVPTGGVVLQRDDAVDPGGEDGFDDPPALFGLAGVRGQSGVPVNHGQQELPVGAGTLGGQADALLQTLHDAGATAETRLR
jgi:hypothetical protein